MNTMIRCLINLHEYAGLTNRLSEGSCRIVMHPTQLHLGENICLVDLLAIVDQQRGLLSSILFYEITIATSKILVSCLPKYMEVTLR